MSDQRNILQNLFREENRYANFGSLLMRIHISGFRCHTSTVIEVESPISAFCGLNGTGNSTVLQLAAVAYKKGQHEDIRYYIKDFIIPGILDEPFAADASVEFGYWQEDRTIKKLSITRSQAEKRWRGYRTLPNRSVYFSLIWPAGTTTISTEFPKK